MSDIVQESVCLVRFSPTFFSYMPSRPQFPPLRRIAQTFLDVIPVPQQLVAGDGPDRVEWVSAKIESSSEGSRHTANIRSLAPREISHGLSPAEHTTNQRLVSRASAIGGLQGAVRSLGT